MVKSTLNKINNWLHAEPFSIVFDGLFWSFVLLLGFPIAGFGCLLRMLYEVLYYLLGPRDIQPKALARNGAKQDLAVVITGCDSGFGKELALQLSAQGFVVFCGCLREESFGQFTQDVAPKAIPILMDVTSDDSVNAALQRIAKWLAKSNDNKKQRRLHALVNNAGICYCGRIDWMKVADFKKIMDVNYFGVIRCTKAFMPIFKKQTAQGTYSNARIVNMISVAGMVAGGEFASAYEASKHATDAFTTNLRLELRSFGVQVVAVNPTFHATPMANTNNIEMGVKSVWDSMSPSLQKEYGEGM